MSNSAVPGQRNNNFVADSDLEAALTAMQERLRQSLSHHPELCAALSDHLTAAVHRVTQRISDEAFHVYVHQKLPQTEDVAFLAAADDDDDTTTNRNTFEFDPTELVDQDAVARVQQLRAQAHTDTQRVTALRNDVLTRSLQMANTHVTTTTVPPPPSPPAMTTPNNNNNLSDYQDSLATLQHTLQAMQTSLQDMETVVPEQLQSLQDTMAAIEANLNKPGRSATDQAIVQRDIMPMTAVASGGGGNARERLAAFLRE